MKTEVRAYIERQPPKARAALKRIRAIVRRLAPGAEERLSYRMPTFFQGGVLLHYAAFDRHIGIYPPLRGNPALQRALSRYAGPKGNLKLPLQEQVPVRLIERLVRHRLRLQAQREAVGRGRRGASSSRKAPPRRRRVQRARA